MIWKENRENTYCEITPELLALKQQWEKKNYIDPKLYKEYNVKRGLRDEDGRGVLTGLTRVAESFQAAGIGLCLDDFGSGYANLNTVMQLPFSVIKLDRSLLFHICTDKNAALFYQSIVSAFCRLGYRIIAEGVETQEEMELLRSWNVDMIQGYYFSRPLPPGDLLRLLTEEAVEQM